LSHSSILGLDNDVDTKDNYVDDNVDEDDGSVMQWRLDYMDQQTTTPLLSTMLSI